MSGFDDHRNFSYSLVATAPSPASTGLSLVVTAGTGSRFPTPPFNATIWAVDELAVPTNAEIVRVTAIATDTLTISRAQEASTARSVIVGDQIAATITDKVLTDIEAATATAPTGLTVINSDVTVTDVANTTTETTVYTYTVPGGTLGTAGFLQLSSVIEIQNTSGGSINLNLKAKYGGTVIAIASLTVPSAAGRRQVWFDVLLAACNATNAQRSAGLAVLGGLASATASGVSVVAIGDVFATGNNALAIDSTAAQVFSLTFQWFAAAVSTSATLHSAYLLEG